MKKILAAALLLMVFASPVFAAAVTIIAITITTTRTPKTLTGHEAVPAVAGLCFAVHARTDSAGAG